MSSLANANGYFNHLYGVAKRYDPSHVPFVFDKHIYRDFVRKFATLVEATISHKFRCVALSQEIFYGKTVVNTVE